MLFKKGIKILPQIIISLVLCAILSGCNRPEACIDADDFGFKKVKVSARVDDDDIHGPKDAQITPWIDFGLRLSGRPLAIMVKNWQYGEDSNSKYQLSAWCPWYGTKKEANLLPKICERLPQCIFQGGNMCTPGRDALLTNPPCIFKEGVGLYALVATEFYEPNATFQSIKNPEGFNFHVGTPPSGYRMYDISASGVSRPAGGLVFNYDGDTSIHSSRINYVNGKLYFKILDNYYQDNGGQYRVSIKSGLIEPGGDLIAYVTNLVKERLFGNNKEGAPSLERYGVVRGIYQQIITNNGFVKAVRGMLTLYVILMGFGFLMGFVQLTKSEVLKRVIKVTVITVLINPTFSWDFFNHYIFIWFYEGTEFIIEILKEAASSGPGSSSIISFLTSEEIFIKLSALLFSTKTGFIYILIYLAMLIFVVMVVFDAAVLYLTALAMMGLLICLAPIFIAFYLFETTKSFFDNWLKQLTGYAIQGILVSAGILFMTMIIRNQIYNTLGFRVCLTEFLALGEPIPPLLAWYFPKIASDANKPPLVMMPIPKDHFKTPHDAALGFGFDNKSQGDFCAAYECMGMRHPDLPFLDPNNPHERRQMNLLRSDDVVDWGGLAIVSICIYLLYHFNTTTVSLAKFLSGTMGNAGSNAQAAGAAAATLRAPIAGALSRAAAAIDQKSGLREGRAIVHDFFAQKKHELIDKKYETYKTNQLRNEALTSGALSSITDKVEGRTGISKDSAMEFKSNMNNGNYTNDLAELINKHGKIGDEGIASKHSEDLLKALSKGEAKDFNNHLSRELFGDKDYSALSADEKKSIDAIMQDKSVQDMLNAKKKEDIFKDQYAKIFLEESQKGMGPLAKRMKPLEDYQNLQNKVKASDAKAAMKQQLRNERWESKKDELKRLLTGDLFGNERNQIMHNDSRLRTHDELLADRERELQAIRDKKALDRATIAAGGDIQRPDYLANLRANGQEDLADRYDKLIKQNIRNDVYKALRNEGDPTLLGDKSIMNMKDEDMKAMMDKMQFKGDEMMENDLYNRMEFNYQDEGAKAELDKRREYLENAVSDEIDRINNMRKDNGMEEYTPPTVKRAGGFGSVPGSEGGSDGGSDPTPSDEGSGSTRRR